MTAKTCERCGCNRKTMVKATIQQIDSSVKMGWLCFPCLFKVITNCSLQVIDKEIYHKFNLVDDERQ